MGKEDTSKNFEEIVRLRSELSKMRGIIERLEYVESIYLTSAVKKSFPKKEVFQIQNQRREEILQKLMKLISKGCTRDNITSYINEEIKALDEEIDCFDPDKFQLTSKTQILLSDIKDERKKSSKVH